MEELCLQWLPTGSWILPLLGLYLLSGKRALISRAVNWKLRVELKRGKRLSEVWQLPGGKSGFESSLWNSGVKGLRGPAS